MPDPDPKMVRGVLAAARDVQQGIWALEARIAQAGGAFGDECRDSERALVALPILQTARAIAYGVKLASGKSFDDWPVGACEHGFLVQEERDGRRDWRCGECGTWFVPEVSDERP